MAAAFALAIFSGRIAIIFVVQNRLRAVLNHFFIGRGCGGSMLFTDATPPVKRKSRKVCGLSGFFSVWRGAAAEQTPSVTAYAVTAPSEMGPWYSDDVSS